MIMKHQKVKQSEFYKVEAGKIKRLKKTCPRCGDGIIMAEHKQKGQKPRYYCGKCHMTVWSE